MRLVAGRQAAWGSAETGTVISHVGSVKISGVCLKGRASRECAIAERERAGMSLVSDACDAKHARQLVRGDLEGPRSGSGACGRLRISSGSRGVEGDVSLYLLHDLVDVPVEHGDGAE